MNLRCECGKTFRVTDKEIGKTKRCHICGRSLVVERHLLVEGTMNATGDGPAPHEAVARVSPTSPWRVWFFCAALPLLVAGSAPVLVALGHVAIWFMGAWGPVVLLVTVLLVIVRLKLRGWEHDPMGPRDWKLLGYGALLWLIWVCAGLSIFLVNGS